MNDAEITLAVEDALLEEWSWDGLTDYDDEIKTPLGEIVVVKKSLADYHTAVDDVWMLFRLTLEDGTHAFFKKEGFYDNFTGYAWEGKFRRVYPKVKMVTTYEYQYEDD